MFYDKEISGRIMKTQYKDDVKVKVEEVNEGKEEGGGGRRRCLLVTNFGKQYVLSEFQSSRCA